MLPCNPLVNPSHLCNRFPYKGTNTGGGVELPLPEQRGSAHSPEDRAGGDEIPAGRGEAALRQLQDVQGALQGSGGVELSSLHKRRTK